MADVVFDFKSDSGEFLADLRNIHAELKGMKETTATSKKDITETFQQASKDAEVFDTELKAALKTQNDQKQLIEVITKKMAELEEANRKAYDSEGAQKYVQKIKALEDEISRLKKELSGVGDAAKKGTDQATKAMVEYTKTLDLAKQKLATLGSGSAEYKKLAAEISAAELAQKKLTIAVDEAGNATGGSRAELKAMREALIQLKQAGLDTTQVYQDLKQSAGELSDTIGDVNEEFKAAGSDTSGIDKMVRGVQLGVNAMGLFEGVTALAGGENKKLQETLVKLNAIMLISQSLQEVMAELKRKDNVLTAAQIALQKAYAIVVGTSTGAMKLLRIAIASTGIGLLLILVGALIANWDRVTAAVKKSFPEFKGAGEIFNRIKVIVSGVGNAIFQYLITPLKIFVSLIRGDIRGAFNDLKNGANLIKNFNAGAQAQREAQQAAATKKFREETLKGVGDNAQAFLDKLKPTLKKEADETNKIRSDGAKAGNDQAKQQAEERRRLAEEQANRIIDLEKKIAKAKVDAMKEGLEKERALENLQFEEEVADLQSQKLKGNAAERQKIDELIEQLKIQHVAKLLVIETKYLEDAKKAYDDAGKSIAGVLQTQEENEVRATEEKYAAILEIIKDAQKKAAQVNNPALNSDIQKLQDQEVQLEEAKQKEIQKIRDKHALERLQKSEELALAENDIFNDTSLSAEQLETLKEQNRLNILIEFAKKRIDVLKASGEQENALAIAQLEKVIQDAEKALNKPKPKQTLFDFLGIDKDGEQKITEIAKGVSKFGEAMADAFDALSEIYDRQIEQHETNLEAIEEDIEAQEDRVDHERELAEDGYANNLGIENQKLEDLKAQKAQEEALLEDSKKKKEKIQKAQIIADSLAQVSNLITAASEIFAAVSSIPIVGVALAIASIAVMFGAFAAAKVNAFKSVGKAEKGRRVASGKRHGEGGNKYISMDGNDSDILEIEQGEWVVNRKSSEKYDPILHAINEDSLSGMPRHKLAGLLGPMGIHLDEDVPKRILNQTQGGPAVVVLNDDKEQWAKQNRILERIAEGGAEYEDGVRIERMGNIVRKIRKK